MNLRKNLFFTVLLICISLPISAQREIISQDCSPSYERSKKAVETFLTWDYLKEKREQSGTDGIPVSQVRHVDLDSDCSQLMAIINGNQKYQNIQLSLSSDETHYFYRTNNYYFILWEEKPVEVPEGAARIKTGPKQIFIVVSEDFQTTWEFYI